MKNKNNRCKKCDSTLTYIRIKDNQRVCRACGFVEKLKKAKVEDLK